MENLTQEERSLELQKEFAREMFEGCETDVSVEGVECGWGNWSLRPECICTECYLG